MCKTKKKKIEQVTFNQTQMGKKVEELGRETKGKDVAFGNTACQQRWQVRFKKSSSCRYPCPRQEHRHLVIPQVSWRNCSSVLSQGRTSRFFRLLASYGNTVNSQTRNLKIKTRWKIRSRERFLHCPGQTEGARGVSVTRGGRHPSRCGLLVTETCRPANCAGCFRATGVLPIPCSSFHHF